MGATQAQLTGEVKLKLYKGSCVVVGRKSAAALYDQALATYDNDDAFDQKAAKGFIDIQALSIKTWAMKQAQLAQAKDAVSGSAQALFGVVEGGATEPAVAQAAVL